MKKLTILLVAMFLTATAFAQNASFKGVVRDTINNTSLSNSVITILRKSDSVLVKFTRSGTSGSFKVPGLDTGNYIVLVSHPSFGDFADNYQITTAGEIDLGNISMTPRSKLLQEVVIKSGGAIRLKGDTIIYTADSFKTRANANVEDLLKKLPGIQVNKKGEITAQGEKVTKVLVDGDEFFSDDPTIATQNLRADAIEKVQVFDKKSDQAAFTGVDDGEKTKTINLQLKQDKKNGYFGKIKVGGGLPNSFNNEAMVNFFKGKRKIAVFGIGSNTGRTGLSWQDNRNYGNSDGFSFDFDQGEVGYSGESQDWSDGNFNGQGLPKSWSGGLHYSNKWNKDKDVFNGNYRFNKLNTAGGSSVINQTILPDTLFFNNQRSTQFNQNIKQRGDAFMDIKLDSFNTLKISANGSMGMTRNENLFTSEALNSKGGLVNNSTRFTNNEGNNMAFNSSILWRKKFRKKGRSLSMNIEERFSSDDSKGFLNAVNRFFDAGSNLTRSDTTDQQKINENRALNISSKISYTEPLSKFTFLEFNYGVNVNNSESKRNSFDKLNGKYEALNPLFSSDFLFNILTNVGGINFRYNKKKVNYSFGGSLSNAAFKQKDLFTNEITRYKFLNFFPKANFSYAFTQFKRVSFNYNGNTRQPNISQLQPLQQNNDPLNIVEGNPNLKQQFAHNFSMNFNDFKVLTNRSIFLGLNGNFTNNAISNSTNTDNQGKTISQAVNVSGVYSVNSYLYYSFRLKKLEADFGINMNASANQNVNIVNGLKNNTTNTRFSFGFTFNYSKENKYDFSINSGINYNGARATIRRDVKTNFWANNHEVTLNVELPGKMTFGTDCEFEFRQKTSVFDNNNNVIRWNAKLEKKLMKKDNLILGVSITDILNQSLGFSRFASVNTVTENTYDVLRRFWMVSVTWNFTKNGAPAKDNF
jgi:Outer membrane protein beta-barrel family